MTRGNARVSRWCVRASVQMHGLPKRVVYILRSEAYPSRHYIGITNDVSARLDWHNHGPVRPHLWYRPWSVVVTIEFPDERCGGSLRDISEIRFRASFTKRHFGHTDRVDSRANEKERPDVSEA